MAMLRVEPTEVRVRTDWFGGKPREIAWGDDRMPITTVVAVRHEDSAYRLDVGPRTLFQVDTPKAKIALSYQHRSKRWLVEGIEGHD